MIGSQISSTVPVVGLPGITNAQEGASGARITTHGLIRGSGAKNLPYLY